MSSDPRILTNCHKYLKNAFNQQFHQILHKIQINRYLKLKKKKLKSIQLIEEILKYANKV